MCIATLIHRRFGDDFVFCCQVNTRFLLWRASTSGYYDFERADRNGCRALVELTRLAVTQLLERPLVLIHVVTQRNLGVDIVAKQINLRLILVALYKLESLTHLVH